MQSSEQIATDDKNPSSPIMASSNDRTMPPPPIEGETPAARRFRTTLPSFFLHLGQPEVPGIWGSWDPSKGPQKDPGSEWPQYDRTVLRPGEGLEPEEAAQIPKQCQSQIANTPSEPSNNSNAAKSSSRSDDLSIPDIEATINTTSILSQDSAGAEHSSVTLDKTDGYASAINHRTEDQQVSGRQEGPKHGEVNSMQLSGDESRQVRFSGWFQMGSIWGR